MNVLMKEVAGPLLYLTLNRPERRNALNREIAQRLIEQLLSAASDERVHAVVLTGAGTAFCAGIDLSEAKSLTDPDARLQLIELTASLLKVIPELDIPVLVAINGPAVGAGAGLAMAADGVFMAEEATISFPELQHGIRPILILPGMERHIGRLATFELLTRGQRVSSGTAFERRWVNKVVTSHRLMQEITIWAEEIAALPRDAIVATKRISRQTAHLSLSDALDKAVGTYR